MKRYRKYSGLILAVLLISCQNFLEPKSQSEYVPKLVSSLDELLVGGVYVGADDYVYLHSVLGVFDDDVAVRPDFPSFNKESQAAFNRVKLAFTWSKDMIRSLSGYDVYGTIYSKIMGANAVLDYLDDVEGSVEEKARVKVQALTMRSWYYWYLVNLYGKPYSADKNALGVPLKLTSHLKDAGVPRNTVGEVYDRIVEDLLEAERLFLTLPKAEWNKRDGRVNLPFVQLLLSRVYLYMENWQGAITYGEKVLQYNFQLSDLNAIRDPTPNVKPKPKPKGGEKKEDPDSDLLYPDYFTWDNPEVIFLLGNKADIVSLPATQIMHTEYYEDEHGSMQPGATIIWTVCITSDDLVNSYEENDLRKSRYLVWEETASGVPVYRIPVSKLPVGKGYRCLNGETGCWGIAFKVTEAYLNVAEAAAKLYQLEGNGEYMTKAVDLMNRLREQRFATGTDYQYTPTGAEELVEFVRMERRRELCFENHRWFDLRRYGMEGLKHVWYNEELEKEEYVLEKNDPGYTLLLPLSAMNKNPQLIQNEERSK